MTSPSYAPFMSDIKNFIDLSIQFELGTPFLPFEQLLAVLPAASRQLLPKPFQNLMIIEQSEIIEYYPVNFKTDLIGKQQEWEAVVLIPFIDEQKLLADLSIQFELGTPFLPFEQLLAVVPAASRQLLPKPFQNLMIMEQSEIIEYYPVNFNTDLNGKQQEWEAVVLIPFIDEQKLLADLSIQFELGTPFLPFEQLLAVVPAASRQLLPKPFQNLMIMEQSEIIEYYPLNFNTDLNGKQQEWEAVVLIPFIDEQKLLADLSIQFELGTPFLPFEQLLAVLPAASRQLLPKPFQNLMIMEQSEIIEYYPLNFNTDLNGKQQEWEAVVLIPFIDEQKLLADLSIQFELGTPFLPFEQLLAVLPAASR